MPCGRELELRAKAPIFFVGIFFTEARARREIFVTEQYWTAKKICMAAWLSGRNRSHTGDHYIIATLA
jgi:hypothetical protein